MKIILALVVFSSFLIYTFQHENKLIETAPFTKQKSPYRELLISFDYSEVAKQKISRIFDEHGFSLPDKMKYTDPFEQFYVSKIDLTSYYPACPVCTKSFKSLEFLHLHIVRKHLLEILDASGKYIIFSDTCEFMKCSEDQLIQDELTPINLQRCMNFLDEYFNFENRNHMYAICKDMVSQENIDVQKDDMFTQVVSWLFLILFAVATLIYLIYVIDGHMAGNKSVLISLDAYSE